jgi:hypothetical protein
MIWLFNLGMEDIPQLWQLISHGMEKLPIFHITSAFTLQKKAAEPPISQSTKGKMDTYGSMEPCEFSHMFWQSLQC